MVAYIEGYDELYFLAHAKKHIVAKPGICCTAADLSALHWNFAQSEISCYTVFYSYTLTHTNECVWAYQFSLIACYNNTAQI